MKCIDICKIPMIILMTPHIKFLTLYREGSNGAQDRLGRGVNTITLYLKCFKIIIVI